MWVIIIGLIFIFSEGYVACAVFHHLVGKDGVVVGIDHVDGLVQDSVNNLRNDGLDDAINNGSIQMITGDGRKGM